MSEKKFIISLIDRFLDNPISSPDDKNLAYFRDILVRISKNSLDIYEFIIGISDSLVLDLVRDYNDSDKDLFVKDFNLLQAKLANFKSSGQEIKLEKKDKQLVDKFVSLLREYSFGVLSSVFKYRLLKSKFDYNMPIDSEDYDLVEFLIYNYCDKDLDVEFDDAMDYLNRYNIGLIRRSSKEPKKEVVYTKVTEVDDENKINPFEMVSFDIAPKDRSRENRVIQNKASEDKSLGALFSSYDVDLNDYSEARINLLKSKFDYNDYQSKIEYLVSNNYLDVFKRNKSSFVNYLVYVSLDLFDKYLKVLKEEYNLSEASIIRLFKVYMKLFMESEFENFKGNLRILEECGITNYNGVILDNISFFYSDYLVNLNKINTLNELGISGTKVIANALNVFVMDFDLILKNIKILETYGFDLRDEKDISGFSVLVINDLATCLDLFIEMGVTETIHEDATLTLIRIKELIVDRIVNSSKEGLSFWKNEGGVPENTYFERTIIDRKILNQDDINLLIMEHPILRIVENHNKIKVYNESYFGEIRRRCELIFEDKIISRIKAYSIFKVLVENHVKDKNALVFALCYNLAINEEEYEGIKDYVVNKLGVKIK